MTASPPGSLANLPQWTDLSSVLRAAAPPMSDWQIFQYRWHIWLGVWALAATAMPVLAWLAGQSRNRTPDRHHPTTVSPLIWWPLPALIVCSVYGATPTWATSLGVAATLILALRSNPAPRLQGDPECPHQGRPTILQPDYLTSLAICVITLWGLWTAIPDTEAPLAMAVAFTVTIDLALIWSWRSRQPPRHLIVAPRTVAVSTSIGLVVATIGGSWTAPQRISGIGCLGLTTALLFWAPRAAPKLGAVGTATALTLHAAIVYLAARVASLASVRDALLLVGLGQAVAIAAAWRLRRNANVPANDNIGSSRAGPTTGAPSGPPR